MATTPHDLLNQLSIRALATCQSWPLDEVQFSVQTGWAQDYGDVFAQQYKHVLEEDEIIDSVLARGRAILAGRGGDGKTWLLRRLFKRVLDRGELPILLDLKQWTGNDYDEWEKWTGSEVGDAADFLVRRFCGLDFGAIDLDRLPPSDSKILLVDGLNEITSTVGAQVLQLLDELVRDQIKLSVLVADRLIRRDLPNPTKWIIGRVLPLSEDEVRKHLGRNVDVVPGGILTSPFFLDAAIHSEGGISLRSQAFQKFLTSHGGVKEADLDRVAAAAFDAYRRSRSRVFQRAAFVDLAGEGTTTDLEESNLLVSSPAGSYFVHHLVHDYLAARHFVGLAPEDWTPQALSTLSFESSSFDALELVFEQLGHGDADRFFRQLYDWNLYGAGYALAQAHDKDPSVSIEMRSIIFAMLAEKRFDAILATQQKANDALMLMRLSDARPFVEARSIEAIFRALEAIPSNKKWFNEWRSLFQTSPDSELSLEGLSSIRDSDSIAGWTVANVAKRARMGERASGLLLEWIQNEPTATVRWRIAHVLGAVPTRNTLDALLHLLDHDPDMWVRYGAIRSIIELAALGNSDSRNAVADAVEARSEAISKEPRISDELRTCLLVDPKKLTMPDWLSFVAKVVREMYLAFESTNERDLWRRCLGEAEELYGNYGGSSRASPTPKGAGDG